MGFNNTETAYIKKTTEIVLPGEAKPVSPAMATYLSVPGLKSNHKSCISDNDPEIPHYANEFHATTVRNRYNGNRTEV